MITGARRGELCALRWRHLDLARRVLVIRASIAQSGADTWEKDTKLHQRRRDRVWAAPALALAAGLGFCVVGVAARSLDIPDQAWRLILDPSVWAIVLSGLTAAVVFAMVLQKGRPTAVNAITFTTNTSLSSIIGLAYLDDRIRVGFIAPAATGFVLAIAGAIGVAHYAATTRQNSRSTTPGRDRAAT